MIPQHKDLAAGGWAKLSFAEQMANIGSEVFRALNWKTKNNPEYSRLAAFRALELIDFTLQHNKTFSRLKELARTRELFADYFFGDNQYGSSADGFNKYFLAFNILARQGR